MMCLATICSIILQHESTGQWDWSIVLSFVSFSFFIYRAHIGGYLQSWGTSVLMAMLNMMVRIGANLFASSCSARGLMYGPGALAGFSVCSSLTSFMTPFCYEDILTCGKCSWHIASLCEVITGVSILWWESWLELFVEYCCLVHRIGM
jgi:hypothetical protein